MRFSTPFKLLLQTQFASHVGPFLRNANDEKAFGVKSSVSSEREERRGGRRPPELLCVCVLSRKFGSHVRIFLPSSPLSGRPSYRVMKTPAAWVSADRKRKKCFPSHRGEEKEEEEEGIFPLSGNI